MSAILVIVLACAAVAVSSHRTLKSYAFTLWVFTFVAASMQWPSVFGTWFGFDLKFLIVPLIQIIMFGMGTTLSVADFSRVLAMPWAVVVGIVAQYSIMPFLGFGLAKTFGFEPEIAVGVILIGSAPGGVASNVINYLARCNVPLSVTMTAISTLLSPIMTPLMMRLLAGKHIEVGFLKMMVDICNMIIVPVVAGLVANRILYGGQLFLRRVGPLALLGFTHLVLAFVALQTPSSWLGPLKSGLVVGFAMVGIATLAKLVVELWLRGPRNWMDRALPLVSMAAICSIIAVITARSSADLKRVGVALLTASMLHNLFGYLLGYWMARALRLNIVDARTVAVEVGMQNGGMASALAMTTLASAKAALAPAIFGPWQNVSGSILASWWRKRPVTVSAGPSRVSESAPQAAADR
jgi:BASS family bile acid:Na+ symporter